MGIYEDFRNGLVHLVIGFLVLLSVLFCCGLIYEINDRTEQTEVVEYAEGETSQDAIIKLLIPLLRDLPEDELKAYCDANGIDYNEYMTELKEYGY